MRAYRKARGKLLGVASSAFTTHRSLSDIVAALAKFLADPVVMFVKSHARIRFALSGLATRIKVENCVVQTAICVVQSVPVPERKRDVADGSGSTTRFVGNVDLAKPEAETFYFKFWIYDEGDLVNSEPVVMVARKSDRT